MIGPLPALTAVDLTFMVVVLRVHGHGERAAAAFPTVWAIRGHAEPWIQLREGETADVEELVAWAAEGLAHYKKPRYLKIVDEFPMMVTGKIQKYKIRETVERELRG